MLLVLEVSKNLVSLHRLCVDNVVSVEFDKQMVRIRNVKTKELIAEGEGENGLYQLPLEMFDYPKAMLTEEITQDRWHTRLGHLNK